MLRGGQAEAEWLDDWEGCTPLHKIRSVVAGVRRMMDRRTRSTRDDESFVPETTPSSISSSNATERATTTTTGVRTQQHATAPFEPRLVSPIRSRSPPPTNPIIPVPSHSSLVPESAHHPTPTSQHLTKIDRIPPLQSRLRVLLQLNLQLVQHQVQQTVSLFVTWVTFVSIVLCATVFMLSYVWYFLVSFFFCSLSAHDSSLEIGNKLAVILTVGCYALVVDHDSWCIDEKPVLVLVWPNKLPNHDELCSSLPDHELAPCFPSHTQVPSSNGLSMTCLCLTFVYFCVFSLSIRSTFLTSLPFTLSFLGFWLFLSWRSPFV